MRGFAISPPLKKSPAWPGLLAFVFVIGSLVTFSGEVFAHGTGKREIAGVVTASALPGHTIMTFGPGHGTQIEYIAPNGWSYLWYPGNSVVLPGRWDIRRRRNGGAAWICYRYQANTYNPVTGASGGKPECVPIKALRLTTVDVARGDVFGLARRRAVPFRLRPGRTSIRQVRAKVGR